MIAGVWFTFDQDGEALVESVASFRKAGGGPVCIFDEEDHPISQDVISRIKPDMMVSTGPRGGNLNGWPAVLMILACCDDVEQAFPHIAGTLKIDCDTKIRDLSWVDETKAMVGWDLGLFRFAYGCCRYLRRGVPAACVEAINSRYTFGRIAEDQGISCEALYRFQGECLLLPGRPAIAGGPRCGAWQYDIEEHLIAPLAEYTVVTYGNRYQMDKSLSPEQKRAKMVEAMKGF